MKSGLLWGIECVEADEWNCEAVRCGETVDLQIIPTNEQYSKVEGKSKSEEVDWIEEKKVGSDTEPGQPTGGGASLPATH